jgi:endonuclease YncB( thermonuclease family)
MAGNHRGELLEELVDAPMTLGRERGDRARQVFAVMVGQGSNSNRACHSFSGSRGAVVRPMLREMLRGKVLVGIIIALAACVLIPVAASAQQPFTQRGTVTAVVDPVTLDVRITAETSERVQLIGLKPPSAGSCALGQATADLGALVSGKPLWLLVVPPRGKAKRIVLAYAILPGGDDVGLELVRRGDVTVAHDGGPFKQLAAYTRAQKAAQAAKLGLWGCTTSAASPAPPDPSAPPGQSHGNGNDHTPPGQGSDKNGKGGGS